MVHSSGLLARVFGAVGLVWIVAHAAGALGALAESTFVVVAVATFAATVVGIRRYRPAIRWPWMLMASSVVVFLAGGAIRQAVGSFADLSAERSLAPDFVVVPGYVLLAVALGGFVRARSIRQGHDLDAVLDSAVACLAVLTFAWVYLMTPALFAFDVPMKVRLSLAIYPPLSVFMAALAMRMFMTSGRRMTVAQRLFVAMMASMVVGDVVSTVGDARLADIPKTLADVPYALAFLALGTICLHPTMRSLTEAAERQETGPVRGRLVLLATALGVPAVVSVAQGGADAAESAVLGGIVLTLTGIVVWRVCRALRAQARAQARLAHEATHDSLTGLRNRAFLLDHLETRLQRRHGELAPLGVLFFDVDRFKLVNDSGGHSVGDQLLRQIATRMEASVGEAAVIARLGGDEFVVVAEVADAEEATQLSERVRRCFEHPFDLLQGPIFASISLGVVIVDEHYVPLDAESVLRDADTAMYQAKAAGRDAVAFFDGHMREQVSQRLQLEQDLRRALGRGELSLHFQPVVDLVTRRVEGVEALLRWSHPERGMVSPATFIPIAEDSGLIVEIGRWILDEAARWAARWGASRPGRPYVAVNLSVRQLRDPLLVDHVLDVLRTHDLPPSALCLELTESLLMENPDAAAKTLAQLRRSGVKLSIDDFGTGYSSLSYLGQFPVDEVKIDRSFVQGLADGPTAGASLVSAIVAMAQALGMSTTAEGVEEELQARRLRELGAHRAQGYLFARPLPADALLELLGEAGDAAQGIDEAAAASAAPTAPRPPSISVGG